MEQALKYSRLTKEKMMKELESAIKEHPNFIVTSANGVSTTDITGYRKAIKKTKAQHVVVKNTLCKRVMDKMDMPGLKDAVDGSCGITFLGTDVVASSKQVLDFSKEHESFVVKAAFIEGQMMGIDKIKQLVSLPPREVLLAMILSSMNAPVTGFVNVLSGALRKFLYALNAVKDKKGESK